MKYNDFFSLSTTYLTLKYDDEKVFFLRAQEERLLGIVGANSTQYDSFPVQIHKLNTPKCISGYIRRKMEKLFFLYTSIGLYLNLNISASSCPIFTILGSLNLSKSVLTRSIRLPKDTT